MITVRRYRPSDHDAVWELHNLALQDVGAHAGNGPWDDDLHNVETVYIARGGEFYVGILDGCVVAMGALRTLDGGRAEVCRMRVHPDLQRRGIGTLILSRLERRAEELGFAFLTLETTVGQVAAMGMYVKAGYRELARHTHLGFEVVIFEKQL